MLSFFSDTEINFVSKRFFFFTLSTFLIMTSIFTIVSKKEKAYGIDFVGGQIQEYRFTEPISIDDLRKTLNEINLNDAVFNNLTNIRKMS